MIGGNENEHTRPGGPRSGQEVNEMRIPGFKAEASLNKMSRYYRASRSEGRYGGSIAPQIDSIDCVANCLKEDPGSWGRFLFSQEGSRRMRMPGFSAGDSLGKLIPRY